MDDESEGIYKRNEGLGFNGMFGKKVDQDGCPRISPKWKLIDFRLLVQKMRMPQIGHVGIIFPAYAPFVSLNQIRSKMGFWALGLVFRS